MSKVLGNDSEVEVPLSAMNTYDGLCGISMQYLVL